MRRPGRRSGSGQSENFTRDRVDTGERKVVIATTHLDSVNLPGGPIAAAPGADGSGPELEVAGYLSTRDWAHDVRLVVRLPGPGPPREHPSVASLAPS
jgi:hypothetical protein